MAHGSHGPVVCADLKCTLHPSGWLALVMGCGTYQTFGLTGHRISGPKTLRNSTLKRRSERCDKYAVLVKLKRIHSRPKFLERARQAFARIPATLQWRLSFFEQDTPVVRFAPLKELLLYQRTLPCIFPGDCSSSSSHALCPRCRVRWARGLGEQPQQRSGTIVTVHNLLEGPGQSGVLQEVDLPAVFTGCLLYTSPSPRD